MNPGAPRPKDVRPLLLAPNDNSWWRGRSFDAVSGSFAAVEPKGRVLGLVPLDRSHCCPYHVPVLAFHVLGFIKVVLAGLGQSGLEYRTSPSRSYIELGVRVKALQELRPGSVVEKLRPSLVSDRAVQTPMCVLYGIEALLYFIYWDALPEMEDLGGLTTKWAFL
ncbi:hypothetical protein AgCh_032508 [Apium graveolens]